MTCRWHCPLPEREPVDETAWVTPGRARYSPSARPAVGATRSPRRHHLDRGGQHEIVAEAKPGRPHRVASCGRSSGACEAGPFSATFAHHRFRPRICAVFRSCGFVAQCLGDPLTLLSPLPVLIRQRRHRGAPQRRSTPIVDTCRGARALGPSATTRARRRRRARRRSPRRRPAASWASHAGSRGRWTPRSRLHRDSRRRERAATSISILGEATSRSRTSPRTAAEGGSTRPRSRLGPAGDGVRLRLAPVANL